MDADDDDDDIDAALALWAARNAPPGPDAEHAVVPAGPPIVYGPPTHAAVLAEFEEEIGTITQALAPAGVFSNRICLSRLMFPGPELNP